MFHVKHNVRNVSCETLKKFKFFRDELLLFQKKFNLIGRGTIENIWIRHFADSAELLKNLQGLKSKKVLDFGTGAGFPGLVIALLSEAHGLNHKITLVESSVKKYNFLERGSDERQYCAPGIDLPLCTFCRTKFFKRSLYIQIGKNF